MFEDDSNDYDDGDDDECFLVQPSFDLFNAILKYIIYAQGKR